jgi:DNA-directed RNA polymerase sigma subunit (sigma70/sigma32)
MLEQIQGDARAASIDLLDSKKVRGNRAEALRLYAGVDSGKWRTYKEVGTRMKLCVERVRQLLLPSKLMLARTLCNRVTLAAARTAGI